MRARKKNTENEASPPALESIFQDKNKNRERPQEELLRLRRIVVFGQMY